jgi:arylsulfatase A-like enzyme
MAGVRKPEEMQGVSFLPLVQGDSAGWRKAMYYHYYEYPQPHHVSPHFGIRTERWVLVRFYGPGDFWELYDLDSDPEELHNLYGQSRYGSMADKLKQQLKTLILQYDDQEALKILNR